MFFFFTGQWGISATGVALFEDIKNIWGNIEDIWNGYEKHFTSPSSLDVAKYSWNLRHPATAFELHLLSLIFRGHQKYLEIFQGHRKYSEQYWFRFPSQNGAKYCAVLATFAPFCDETVTSLTGVYWQIDPNLLIQRINKFHLPH